MNLEEPLVSRILLFSATHGFSATTDSIRVRVTLRLVVYLQSVPLGDKLFETHGQLLFQLNTWQSLSLRNILSNERMGLSFKIAAGHRQRSHSQVQVS
jgi:hypothetical protein